MQSMSEFRNARIIDAARHGSTISRIAYETGIPFASVRRAVYAFENIGVIKAHKSGNKVFVRVTNQNHPIVSSMVGMARWITAILWEPDIFVARIFEKNGINYAFIGTSRIKYTKHESRNMVQIAVSKEHYEKAKQVIKEGFNEINVRITDDPRKTIGNAMSIIYVKCFPVDKVKYKEYMAKTKDSNEAIRIRIGDKDTERRAMQNAAAEDKMFIPSE